jgi:hypothetical protein
VNSSAELKSSLSDFHLRYLVKLIACRVRVPTEDTGPTIRIALTISGNPTPKPGQAARSGVTTFQADVRQHGIDKLTILSTLCNSYRAQKTS